MTNAARKSGLHIGPLFSPTDYEAEAEEIWDDNNDDPADEAQWLGNFDKHAEAISASEKKFLAEFQSRVKKS